MAKKYILEHSAFYGRGHYYKPGEPFELPPGCKPPTHAIPYEAYVAPEPVADSKPALSEMGKVEKSSKRKD